MVGLLGAVTALFGLAGIRRREI
ncbi:hypothetical protein PI20285_02300 [Pediococcus inopinatus]|nr:hypothetical protein PI20285_02300 [Pediococcus inopinatus]